MDVEPETHSRKLFNTLVSDIQTGLSVADGAITGTLKYLDSGEIADYWGAGNFMALKFTPGADATSVRVGMVPSASSMDLQELDEDLNGVFKVTDKDSQVFRVVSTDGTHTKTVDYDLSGLTVQGE